jgi:predicted transcriptional regulator
MDFSVSLLLYATVEMITMPKSLVEMASEIVAAQASHTSMGPEEISEGVRSIFEVLQSLHTLETGMTNRSESDPSPKLNPQDSIQRNRVICLECNKDFKLLSNRHLALHGLTSRDYKLKYGLPLRQPLSAKSLTQTRRKIAKEKELGAKLVAYRKKRRKGSGN